MTQREPLYREDDNELLGFVTKDSTGWRAETIFGYLIDRTLDRQAAVNVLQEKGLTYLTGVWQYFDEDDQEWHPCILKEVYEHQVTVIRTNAMGYQDPDDYKIVSITKVDETRLVKG